MEMKVENQNVGGATPLPQRQQQQPKGMPANKNATKQNMQAIKQDRDNDCSGPSEKKARLTHQNGGGGAVVNKPNNFGNKGHFQGNRNRNRGGNQNRGNFNNQNQANVSNEAQKPNPDDGKIEQQHQTGGGGGGGNMGGGSGGGNMSGGGGHQGQQNRNRGNNSNHNNSNNNHGRDRSRGGRGQMGHGSGGGGGVGGVGNIGSGGGGGGGGGGVNNTSRSDEFFISQRLRAISGPTHELAPIEVSQETKFSGRNRLYVGNLTNDATEDELREMFKPHGEIAEIFLNTDKNFAFLKVDYHVNAEKAKRALDGTTRKGRQLRVRFAPNATILRVSNLTPFVSNELLYSSFEIFGPLERASINVDDRGKHTGEGVVEFAKKSSANTCLRFCSDKCYFLTTSLRPCFVEPLEVNDDNDGLPEKSLNKKSPEFNHERGTGPRFADLGSFEHEYGTRWKHLHELFKNKQEALKRELKVEEERLEAQMEYARYEHETELLRQELRKRESDNERKKIEWELREKQAEDMRKRDEENMRRQQNEMQTRMQRQEEEMRRRQQENTLFIQAQQLNSLLDQQENCSGGLGGIVGNNGGGGGVGGNNTGFDNFMGNNSNSPFEVFRGNNNAPNAAGGGGGNPGPKNLQDPFAFEFGGNNQNQSGQGGNQRGNNGGNNNPWERRRRF